MSKALSLKLQDDIFKETEELTRQTHTPRNAYINKAVAYYNRLQKKMILKKQIAKSSHLVRENSMEVLHEFEALEDEIPGLE